MFSIEISLEVDAIYILLFDTPNSNVEFYKSPKMILTRPYIYYEK